MQVLLANPAVILVTQSACTSPVNPKAVLIFSEISLELLLVLFRGESSKHSAWIIILNSPNSCSSFKCKSLGFP